MRKPVLRFDIEELYNCKFIRKFFPHKKDSVKARLGVLDTDLCVINKFCHGSSSSENLEDYLSGEIKLLIKHGQSCR